MLIRVVTKFNESMLEESGLSVKDIEQALQELENLLGNDFIHELQKTNQRDTLENKHPVTSGYLGDVFNIHTLELVELSICLQALRSVEGFERLLIGLRNTDTIQFRNYFYQVLMTYRLFLLTKGLKIEPNLDGKTPDVFFRYKEEDYVADMTQTSYGEISKKVDVFVAKLGSLETILEELDYKCFIEITITDISFIKSINRNLKKIKNLIKENTEYKKNSLIGGVIEIVAVQGFDEREDIFKEFKFSKAIKLGKAPCSDKNNPNTYQTEEVEIFAQIILSQEFDAKRDDYDRIVAHLKSKSSQLKPFRGKYKTVVFLDTQYKWDSLDTKRLGNKITSNTKALYDGVIISSQCRVSESNIKFGIFGISQDDNIISLSAEIYKQEKARDFRK